MAAHATLIRQAVCCSACKLRLRPLIDTGAHERCASANHPSHRLPHAQRFANDLHPFAWALLVSSMISVEAHAWSCRVAGAAILTPMTASNGRAWAKIAEDGPKPQSACAHLAALAAGARGHLDRAAAGAARGALHDRAALAHVRVLGRLALPEQVITPQYRNVNSHDI